jgi:hypothetical protein
MHNSDSIVIPFQSPECFGQSFALSVRFCAEANVFKAIEVPETLLKKRKQNEKAREERLAAAVAARKVRYATFLQSFQVCMMYTIHSTNG